VFSNKSLGIAVTAVAVLAGLMIGVAGPGRAQDTKAPDKDKAPAAPVFNWKDNNEFVEADAASKEADPAKRLALLDKWKKDYPATDPAILVVRQNMFLAAYVQTNLARQAFDEAVNILKDRPKDFSALQAVLQMATQIKPAPTSADLDTGERVANLFIDNPDSVKPAEATDAQWATTKAALKTYSEGRLMAIYVLRKDDKRSVDDLRKLIQRDPSLAAASYTLGRTMMTILQAEKKPENQPPAFYQIARSLVVEGPNALPAAQKPAIQTYLTNAYKNFHGSDSGLDQLLTMAKASPFPPEGFNIKSTVDIANEEAAAVKAEQEKDPLMFLWLHSVKEKLATEGDAYFDASLKDAGLPPPNDKTTPPTPVFFTGHIISISPNPKPKEILVGVEKADVADAKLTFDTALPGKMDPGEVIQFAGRVADWSHDPKNVVVTFDVDPKEGMHDTWTGKNATGAKGAAPKGAGGAKGTGKAAPPKQ
jgi:hypothetical protein